MVGGMLLIGLLGIILGPLILAYLFIIIEAYRNKKLPGAVIQSP
jgi:predicted PurR-regulated permease PerM